MGEESVATFGTAPRRDRDFLDTESPRLLGQDVAQIEVGSTRSAKPIGDFRTHFIAVAANANAAMHYDIARFGKASPFQQLHAAREDAAYAVSGS